MNLFDTTNSPLEPLQPTPEQLAARMTRVAADTTATEAHTQMEVGTIIALAEAGGEEHMTAVAEVIARIPNGPPPPNAPMYEASSGRPAWHENNILLSCEVRIDGRVFAAREAFDPMMLEIQFGGTDSDRFEHFIDFFLKTNFGKVAVADPASTKFLRDRVWIVKPGDTHDFRRCAKNSEPPVYPRCTMGVITTKPFEIVPGEYDKWNVKMPPYAKVDKSAVLGQCPCRCHRDNFYGNGAKRFAALNGLAVFDELMVDEEGKPRDHDR
ncbi:MAG TPA: hypothetical protein VGS97_19830 [Actinocrinis sp.]|uniref:hypothetical protein n=1 Tax=Actinocrinis sp. TaxID=1920516 RepID=UPI002DDD0EC5|nr:hypothetical protein [Actinocrinis sp.]HEV2346360.1 hypothetical protein [Actinocrinis sp.]